mmetsp:Transcript_23205/g.39282  ORF Transcript_23205/g.39282 Transcript_23205/m.39282 type:complete len:294 (+) Transcript_23205:160-1041(+)
MSDFTVSDTSKFSVLEPSCFIHNTVESSEDDDTVSSDNDNDSDSVVGVSNNIIDSTSRINESQHILMEKIISTSTYNDACNLSKVERKKTECSGDITLTYGEVLLDSFRDAVMPVFTDYGGLAKGGKFYDLGSGRGRASFFVTLLVDEYYHTTGYLKSCTGIEIISSLHALSLEALARWKILYPEYLSSSPSSKDQADANNAATDITLAHGSIIDLQCADWTDGDLVFVNSTCFTAKLMQDISRIAKNMKIGSFFITFTHILSEEDTGFTLLEELRREMSWGSADIFIHQKIQ